MWNDYWRTTQKTATRSNPQNNFYAQKYTVNPYQQQQPPLITTTEIYDTQLSYNQQLQQHQLQHQQQQQPLKQQQQLGNNNNKNEDPLALLLKNKYYQLGPQELKTINQPQMSNGGPYGKSCYNTRKTP